MLSATGLQTDRLGSPLPADGSCLVVQMPSVEEMRREVADITCQMQSVYLDDEKEIGLSLPVTQNENQNSAEKGLIRNPHTKLVHLGSSSALFDQPIKANLNESPKIKSNSMCRLRGIRNEIVEDFPVQASVSSSLPHEEQVLEEFVINGKRYRQTYQRRVVLERKTTRDVFFLPASSGDVRTAPSTQKAFEYSSPCFTNPDCDHAALIHGTNSTYEADSEERPRLDLAVVRNPDGTGDNDSCLTPTVIMRSVQNSPEKNATLPSKGIMTHEDEMSHKHHMINDGFLANGNTNSKDYPDALKAASFKPKRSRSRYGVKVIVDAIKHQFSTSSSRTKNIISNTEEHLQNHKIVNDNNSTCVPKLEDVTSDENTSSKQSKNKGRPEIVGYMYKFGVWDDQEPVLDPRLPLAIRSSMLSHEGLIGTVVANPPEWHHAEVGLGDSGSAPVRGRVVACLQRFTQQSLSSGKPLHRSTYVQQTRLVRQRHEDKLSSRAHDVVPPTDSLEEQTKCEMIIDQPSEKKVWISSTAQYVKCSNDRLQLLQSLCPAAAAATILLGRQFSKQPVINSISDSESYVLEESAILEESRVLVSASSWCPAALIAKDLSPYIAFTTAESFSNTGPPTLHSDADNEAPQPLIRGGTLDGLIAYAITVLQNQTKASPLDLLFLNVFRVTYPTFTTPERVIERLILMYVAHAPIEPGCHAQSWSKALEAAQFLVTISNELHPEQMTASLVLRLARFARLLTHDGVTFAEHIQRSTTKSQLTNHGQDVESHNNNNRHKLLADQLLDNLPLLTVSAQLRERIASQTKQGQPRQRRNSSHIPADQDPDKEQRGVSRILERARTMKPSGAKTKINHSSGYKSKPNNLQFSINDVTLKSPMEADVNQHQQDENFIKAVNRAKLFLAACPQAVATEITRVEEEIFAQINFHEFLDVKSLERGEAKSLSRCVDHFNQVTRWAKSLLFVLAPKLGESFQDTLHDGSNLCTSHKSDNAVVNHNQTDVTREKLFQENASSANISAYSSGTNHDLEEKATYTCIPVPSTAAIEKKYSNVKQLSNINMMFCQICEVLKHLKDLKNFSSFLSLLLAVQEVPDILLHKKSKAMLAKFASYMKPPMFSDYRRDLEAASLPYLPYLGLIFQQLIHLHAGNPTYLTDVELPKVSQKSDIVDSSNSSLLLGVMVNSGATEEPFVNMWRCWKHYLILGYFIKRKENPNTSRHHLPFNLEIQQIISDFQDQFSDVILDKAKEELIANVKPKRPFWSNHC